MKKTNHSPMTFRSHLMELRARFFWVICSILVGSVIGYFFRESLISFLISPLHAPLYYTSPVGGVEFIFLVCFLFGFLVSIPFIIYHTFMFIAPALPSSIRISAPRLILVAFILMLAGIVFAYTISLPTLLRFFFSFSFSNVKPLISVKEYFSFIINYYLIFSIIFQLPLILFCVHKLRPLSIKWLLNQERIVIVISFIIGAIFAPDPVNQIIMALPIIILYQIAILIIWLGDKIRLFGI